MQGPLPFGFVIADRSHP